MSTKESLLIRLKQEQDGWVSGEELSSELGITRAAVSKHMGTLRKEGYEIASSSGKGYRLVKVPDRIHMFEIRDSLKTREFGKKSFEFFEKIDSTNNRAREMAEKGAPQGSIVIAESQTAGRGRMGREWFSPQKGGIYLSLILRPMLPPAETPGITLMMAVAIAEALLASVEMNIRIKWPNDILCNGKKLAGILTELSTDMDMVRYVIVGMGVNVNIPACFFKEELKAIATSILIESGNPFNRSDLIRGILERFEQNYETFLNKEAGSIIEKWKALSRIIGEPITIDVLGKVHKGRVVDMDDSGVLITEDENGKQHRFYSGDIML